MPYLETEKPRLSEGLAFSEDSYNQNFEMAQLLFYGGSLSKALVSFKKAMEQFKQRRRFDSYLSCYIYMIQILSELEQFDELKTIKKEVESLCQKENLGDKPLIKIYSAYYSIYIDKSKKESVSQILNESLKLIFAEYDKAVRSEDFLSQNELRFQIMFGIYVYCIYYLEEENYKSCLKELDNLKALLKDFLKTKDHLEEQREKAQFSQDKETHEKLLEGLTRRLSKVKMMRLGVLFMEASVEMRYLKKYKEAYKMLWNLYEETNKNNNNYLAPYILFYMSECKNLLDDKKEARLFFKLAEKNANPERKLFLRYLEKLREKLSSEESDLEHYDIVFNTMNYKVTEKTRGVLELKNQFLLIDLLKIFILNQGMSYSKEQIVKELWGEDYNPEVHDNKIYVTIKRLREAVELDSTRPTYICRNSRGYYLSKTAKILLKEN